MNEEIEWTIEDIRKSIHTLNENLTMIAYQLYQSHWIESLDENALLKNFFIEREKLFSRQRKAAKGWVNEN